jgi:hypothetical protein
VHVTQRALTQRELADQAENYVIDRIRSLPGWTAVNANDIRYNQPRYDVIATDSAGREVRVSVKSASTGGAKQAYTVDTPDERYPVAVYAFVDMTGDTPGRVYLAGSRTVMSLAVERHAEYQSRRGKDPLAKGSWKQKIGRVLLTEMGTLEAWGLLDSPEPTTWPRVTARRRQHARDDAPPPRFGQPASDGTISPSG